MSRFTRALLVTALLVSAGACSESKQLDGAGGGAGKAKGAAGELREAALATASATSFRFEGTGQQKRKAETNALAQRVKGEFAAPDRIHLTTLALDGSPQRDLWLQGGQAWTAEPGGGNLQCGPAGSEGLSDPRVLLRAIAQATTSSASERGYTFTLPESAARSVFGQPDPKGYDKVSGDVSLAGEYVATVHLVATTPEFELRADIVYIDIGSPVSVDPPPGCVPQPATTSSSSSPPAN